MNFYLIPLRHQLLNAVTTYLQMQPQRCHVIHTGYTLIFKLPTYSTFNTNINSCNTFPKREIDDTFSICFKFNINKQKLTMVPSEILKAKNIVGIKLLILGCFKTKLVCS